MKWISPGEIAGAVVAILCAIALGSVLAKRLAYYPEIGYDESAAALSVSLLDGHFGNHVDPLGNGFSRYRAMDASPPVYYLAGAVVTAIAGFGVVQARAVSLIFVLLTAALCYGVARSIGGWRAGLIATAWYLFIPTQVYTVVARPDVAVAPFLLASCWMLLVARKRGGRWWVAGAGLALGCAICSHLVALLAAPVVAVFALYVAWRQPHRTAAVALFSLGVLVPIAWYVYLIHPYEMATFRILAGYRSVGVTNVVHWTDVWPLRATLQHVDTLRQSFPGVLFVALPAIVITTLLAVFSSRWRARMGEGALPFMTVTLATFLMLGTNPNINVYGYYGPMYLVFFAVAAGCLGAALLPRHWIGGAGAIAMALAIAGWLLVPFDREVEASIERSGAPLTALEPWAIDGRSGDDQWTLAPAHWVLALNPRKTTSALMVKGTTGVPDWYDGLRSYADDLPPLASYPVLITDAYAESIDFSVDLLRARGLNQNPGGPLRLRHEYFQATKLLYDPVRMSSNATLWRRIGPGTTSAEWPSVINLHGRREEELRIVQSCVAVTGEPVIETQTVTIGRTPIRASRVFLRFAPALAGRLVLVRVLFANVDQPVFAVTSNDMAAVEATDETIRTGTSPTSTPWTQVALASARLSNGERGRDFVIEARTTPAVILLYTTGAASIRGVTVAALLAREEPCATDVEAGIKALAGGFAQPAIIRVIASPARVAVGEPITIRLSRSASVRLVVYQNGKMVREADGIVSDVPSIAVDYPGNFGIEVWMTDPLNGVRTVIPVFVEVQPRS
jgi:hypothetical protein